MVNLALLYEQLSNDDKAWLGNQPAFETLSAGQIRSAVTEYLLDTLQLPDAPIARYAELFCREYFQNDRDQHHRCWVFRNKQWDPEQKWSADTKKVWLSWLGERFACGYMNGTELVLFLIHSWCKSSSSSTSINIKHKDRNISVSRQAVIDLLSEYPNDVPNVFIDIDSKKYTQKAQSVKAVNCAKARESHSQQVTNMLQAAKDGDGSICLSEEDVKQDAMSITRLWSDYIPVSMIQPLCRNLTALERKITTSNIASEDKKMLLTDLRQNSIARILQQLQGMGCDTKIKENATYIKAPLSVVSTPEVIPAHTEPPVQEVQQAAETVCISPALLLILQSMLAYIRDTNKSVAEFWEKRIQTEIPNMEI